ncbi:MAG: AAA family ATPase [Thermodesulfobacteriota bacterium]|nr:AAA family ATPase [Thermodesulfobacteriota bacterium]
MYKNFFGLKERPFKLVPNPAYLYLSRSHEEAIAHLKYAISQGDGFVEITGEVGTGKTTICRSFLQDLDGDIEAAYIFNPKLDSLQLLKAINDEFGISSESDNTKDLIDTLNIFLMDEKTKGKKVILLIDEAQNLNKEVLEQLRLLSNLETDRDKLLQIILVGQPELGEMLDSNELRQLGQRITLCCHLSPLSYKETRGYIQHRINIASQRPVARFSRLAFHYIFKYSRGIPRLINIACDRMLLYAYVMNRHKITGSIARKAIMELASGRDLKRYTIAQRNRLILFVFLACIAFFLFIFYTPGIIIMDFPLKTSVRKKSEAQYREHSDVKISTGAIDEKHLIEKREKGITQVEPVIMKPKKNLSEFLEGLDVDSSRYTAIKSALDFWNTGSQITSYLDQMEDDFTFFKLAAKQNGLLIQRIAGDLGILLGLNLPAILEFYLPTDLSSSYLTLCRIEGNRITLIGGEENDAIEIELHEMAPYWSGEAYILWKNFRTCTGIIPLNAPIDSIITLKILLRDIGFDEIEINPSYDEKTKRAVELIQERHGVPVDGIVGSLTKIVLYNEIESLKIPHILGK